jgi:hypothetical protein
LDKGIGQGYDMTVINTYVRNRHTGKGYRISTIERESSAVEFPIRYNETIVWEYDFEKRQHGEMLSMHEDLVGSINKHIELIGYYFEAEKGDEEDDNRKRK